jgi:uncharacterized membrane protein YidH (DUF202 family)
LIVSDPCEDELNGLRIRQLAALRRAAYRSRSYCIIAMVVCAVGIVQIIHELILGRRTGATAMRQSAYVAAAFALLLLGIQCLRWARHFHAEAKRSRLTDPAAPPDFSNLSDGTQRARNLENM